MDISVATSLLIMKNATLNICIQHLCGHRISLPSSIYLGVEYLGHVEELSNYFQVCNILLINSPQECMRVPIAIYPHQHCYFLSMLVCVKWYLTMVLIFIFQHFLMLSLFMGLLAICISCLENFLFMSCAHFLIGLSFY